MDLNSSNGTFVNGCRLKPNHFTPLKHGDVVRIGLAKWTFSFELPKRRPADAASPAAADAVRVADAAGPAHVADAAGPARVVDAAGPARVVDAAGPARVVDAASQARVVDAAGAAWAAGAMPPAPPVVVPQAAGLCRRFCVCCWQMKKPKTLKCKIAFFC